MPSTTLHAGDQAGPFDLALRPELVRQFAEATLDPVRSSGDGPTVPPSLIATLAFDAQLAAFVKLVPDDVLTPVRSGVHGQHDLLLHRPLLSDEQLRVFVETHSARPSGHNLHVTLHHLVVDERGDLAAEQWWTTVLIGTTAGSTGPRLPDYGSPGDSPTAPVVEDVVRIDGVMARRYAQVSGDFSEHHFSEEAARRSGATAPFLHGLCTLALCARTATQTAADGDPERIRRMAVRFAAPARLDHDLTVRLFDRPDGDFGMEAVCDGDLVITNGLVQLAP